LWRLRLRAETLSVKIAGRSIADVVRFSIKEARQFFETLTLSEREMTIARRVLKEIRERLGFLSRSGSTISRSIGRPRRWPGARPAHRLATQIGSSLVGVLYILDEPPSGSTSGTTPGCWTRSSGSATSATRCSWSSTTRRPSVRGLRGDLGPGAGELGGHVVAVGTPDEVMANPHRSPAGSWPRAEHRGPRDAADARRQVRHHPQSREHNLKG